MNQALESTSLFCTAYVSRCDVAMQRGDLQALAQQARTDNAAHDITGFLVYRAGMFFQCLEGPQDAVDTLMRRIQADPRHSQLLVVLRQRIDRRDFNDWAMHLVDSYLVVMNRDPTLPSPWAANATNARSESPAIVAFKTFLATAGTATPLMDRGPAANGDREASATVV